MPPQAALTKTIVGDQLEVAAQTAMRIEEIGGKLLIQVHLVRGQMLMTQFHLRECPSEFKDALDVARFVVLIGKRQCILAVLSNSGGPGDRDRCARCNSQRAAQRKDRIEHRASLSFQVSLAMACGARGLQRRPKKA